MALRHIKGKMMAYLPAQQLSTPYEDYPGYFLKCFAQGTTTPLSMATDSTGGTLLAKAEVSSGGAVQLGFIKTAGNVIFQPYLNATYDAYLFPTSSEADVNDTSNAIKIADNVNLEGINADLDKSFATVALMVASADLTVGELVSTFGYFVQGDGGDNTYEVVASATGTDDGGSFIDLGGSGHQAKGLFTGGVVHVNQFGAVGDWDHAAQSGTDSTTAFQNAGLFAFSVLVGDVPYRLTSVLTFSFGVVFYAHSTPNSSQQGAQLVCDHAGGGILFDGNNSSMLQVGTGCGIKNIQIVKAGGQNGGTAIEFKGPDNDNLVGFVLLDNVLVNGAGAGAPGGEGLWAEGIVMDGTNQANGLKNAYWSNVGITGISTADKYVHLISVVQLNWESGYLRDASASFPSFGACGMTIESAGSSSSDFLFFTDVVVLGTWVLGEVTHIYASNCESTDFAFLDHAGGSSIISWTGGEITQGPNGILSDRSGLTATWALYVRTTTVNINETESILSFTSSSVSLAKGQAGYGINNDGASATVTLTLPELSSGFAYDYDIANVEAQTLIVDTTATDSFYNTSLITDIRIPENGRVRFFNIAESNSQFWSWEVLSGNVTLTGFGSTVFNGVSSHIVSSRTLTGGFENRPVDGPVWRFDPGGLTRNIGTNNAVYPDGYVLTIHNSDQAASSNLVFEPLGLNLTIGPKLTKQVLYDKPNDEWSQIT